ncbi:MAG: nucleotidyltransferase domain-containing protein [Dysgonomonas sp.]|nr:nucleotidyltransferase domain-containing protein [Dysgonomonas sp.]
MKATVQQKLHEIEKEHNIRVLYACESGSRAWGFPSPDSDYDIRFIYARPLNDYLSVKVYKDNLRLPIDDELDVEGWDIYKALQLMSKSNSTVFEWIQSPTIYLEKADFRNELWDLSQHYFCARTNIHHYLGIAQGALKSMDNDKLKIKKLFYVLRPLLAALWCAEKGSIAPMDIQSLICLLPSELQRKVTALIALKANKKDSFEMKPDRDARIWIEKTFDHCDTVSKTLEKKFFEVDKIDEFFRKTVLE